MNESTNTPDGDIEQLLVEAGFTFTVVERCPDPRCRECGLLPKSRAA